MEKVESHRTQQQQVREPPPPSSSTSSLKIAPMRRKKGRKKLLAEHGENQNSISTMSISSQSTAATVSTKSISEPPVPVKITKIHDNNGCSSSSMASRLAKEREKNERDGSSSSSSSSASSRSNDRLKPDYGGTRTQRVFEPPAPSSLSSSSKVKKAIASRELEHPAPPPPPASPSKCRGSSKGKSEPKEPSSPSNTSSSSLETRMALEAKKNKERNETKHEMVKTTGDGNSNVRSRVSLEPPHPNNASPSSRSKSYSGTSTETTGFQSEPSSPSSVSSKVKARMALEAKKNGDQNRTKQHAMEANNDSSRSRVSLEPPHPPNKKSPLRRGISARPVGTRGFEPPAPSSSKSKSQPNLIYSPGRTTLTEGGASQSEPSSPPSVSSTLKTRLALEAKKNGEQNKTQDVTEVADDVGGSRHNVSPSSRGRSSVGDEGDRGIKSRNNNMVDLHLAPKIPISDSKSTLEGPGETLGLEPQAPPSKSKLTLLPGRGTSTETTDHQSEPSSPSSVSSKVKARMALEAKKNGDQNRTKQHAMVENNDSSRSRVSLEPPHPPNKKSPLRRGISTVVPNTNNTTSKDDDEEEEDKDGGSKPRSMELLAPKIPREELVTYDTTTPITTKMSSTSSLGRAIEPPSPAPVTNKSMASRMAAENKKNEEQSGKNGASASSIDSAHVEPPCPSSLSSLSFTKGDDDLLAKPDSLGLISSVVPEHLVSYGSDVERLGSKWMDEHLEPTPPSSMGDVSIQSAATANQGRRNMVSMTMLLRDAHTSGNFSSRLLGNATDDVLDDVEKGQRDMLNKSANKKIASTSVRTSKKSSGDSMSLTKSKMKISINSNSQKTFKGSYNNEMAQGPHRPFLAEPPAPGSNDENEGPPSVKVPLSVLGGENSNLGEDQGDDDDDDDESTASSAAPGAFAVRPGGRITARNNIMDKQSPTAYNEYLRPNNEGVENSALVCSMLENENTESERPLGLGDRPTTPTPTPTGLETGGSGMEGFVTASVGAVEMPFSDDDETQLKKESSLLSLTTPAPEPQEKWFAGRKRKILLAFVALCLLIIILVALLVVLLQPSNNNKSNPSQNVPSHGISKEHVEAATEIIKSISDPALVTDQINTPQHKALEWLIETDQTYVDVDFNNQESSVNKKELIQRYVFVLIYFATGGTRWKWNKRWLDPKYHVCDWDFIKCEGDADEEVEGRVVTSFVMENNIASGTFPREIWSLTSLETLNLNKNAIKGEISQDIGNMTSLVELHLANNFLDTTLPSEIGNLNKLKILNLENSGSINGETKGNNEIRGTIPTEVGNMVSLVDFLMRRNQFLSGTIPSELGKLAHLEKINLEGGEVGGAIPLNIWGHPNLAFLFLRDNEFSSGIPPEVMNAKNMVEIDLENNKIEGKIPTQMGNMANLEYINFIKNKLTGEIPSELGNVTRLTNLLLETNNLAGTIPAELGRLSAIKYLRLLNNDLSGSVPQEICPLLPQMEQFTRDCKIIECECSLCNSDESDIVFCVP